MRQISIFDKGIKLNDIFNFVHSIGKWQADNCYKTEAVLLKDTIVISNHFTYGTKEQREITHDAVVLEAKDGYARLCSVEVGRVDRHFLANYKWILDDNLYEEFAIPIDIKLKKAKTEASEDD